MSRNPIKIKWASILLIATLSACSLIGEEAEKLAVDEFTNCIEPEAEQWIEKELGQ